MFKKRLTHLYSLLTMYMLKVIGPQFPFKVFLNDFIIALSASSSKHWTLAVCKHFITTR